MENDLDSEGQGASVPAFNGQMSQTRKLADGSVVVIWPRNPLAVDDRTEVDINFRPLPRGPVLRVAALRYRPFDVSSPFGVMSWAYRIPPHEVRRATSLARAQVTPEGS